MEINIIGFATLDKELKAEGTDIRRIGLVGTTTIPHQKALRALRSLILQMNTKFFVPSNLHVKEKTFRLHTYVA